jgi:hypothetical protein
LLDEMDCDTCDAVGNEISCFSFFLFYWVLTIYICYSYLYRRRVVKCEKRKNPSTNFVFSNCVFKHVIR